MFLFYSSVFLFLLLCYIILLYFYIILCYILFSSIFYFYFFPPSYPMIWHSVLSVMLFLFYSIPFYFLQFCFIAFLSIRCCSLFYFYSITFSCVMLLYFVVLLLYSVSFRSSFTSIPFLTPALLSHSALFCRSYSFPLYFLILCASVLIILQCVECYFNLFCCVVFYFLVFCSVQLPVMFLCCFTSSRFLLFRSIQLYFTPVSRSVPSAVFDSVASFLRSHVTVFSYISCYSAVLFSFISVLPSVIIQVILSFSVLFCYYIFYCYILLCCVSVHASLFRCSSCRYIWFSLKHGGALEPFPVIRAEDHSGALNWSLFRPECIDSPARHWWGRAAWSYKK